jgi:hypothetical protein
VAARKNVRAGRNINWATQMIPGTPPPMEDFALHFLNHLSGSRGFQIAL